MSGWTGLDFFIFLIFLVNVLLGMARGGMKETIALLSLCASLVVTIKFTIPLATFINSSPLMSDVITSQFVQNFMRSISMPPLTDAMLIQVGYSVSLLICFVGSYSICEGVLAYSSANEAFGLSTAIMNRKLGASFGATRGFVLVLLFIIVLTHLFDRNMPASKFVDTLGGSASKMDKIIYDGAPQRYLEILEDKDLYNEKNVIDDLTKPT